MHGVLDTIEADSPTAVQDVIKLGRTFVKMEFGAVDIDGVRPRRR